MQFKFLYADLKHRNIQQNNMKACCELLFACELCTWCAVKCTDNRKQIYNIPDLRKSCLATQRPDGQFGTMESIVMSEKKTYKNFLLKSRQHMCKFQYGYLHEYISH